jgi:hypothetical protein
MFASNSITGGEEKEELRELPEDEECDMREVDSEFGGN